MQSNTLTLRELAEKLDVSKSYIDKIIRTLGMHTELRKNGNKYIVDILQQEEIESFIKKKNIHSELHTESNNKAHINTRFENEFLRSQLIDRTKEIKELHKILDQQQQLTLQSNKQIEKLQFQLELKETDDDHSESAEPTNRDIAQLTSELAQQKKENEQLQNELSALKSAPKKGFWQRLFHS